MRVGEDEVSVYGHSNNGVGEKLQELSNSSAHYNFCIPRV